MQWISKNKSINHSSNRQKIPYSKRINFGEKYKIKHWSSKGKLKQFRRSSKRKRMKTKRWYLCSRAKMSKLCMKLKRSKSKSTRSRNRWRKTSHPNPWISTTINLKVPWTISQSRTHFSWSKEFKGAGTRISLTRVKRTLPKEWT